MKKLTYKFIKEQFEKEGYNLLSKRYINSRTKLKYICPNGHEHSITWSDFKQRRRCRYCANEKIGKIKRLDFDFVKKEFEKENYVLLPTTYKNNDQKLLYRCPERHEHSISWHNWKSGWRCPICHHKKLALLLCGGNHPNWKGGVSCEPYCDAWADKEYKESIKERDNYECQNPDCWQNIDRISIHHIDYNKKNCHPHNLITLCASCNSRANFDRQWHKAWYKAILEKRMIRRNQICAQL